MPRKPLDALEGANAQGSCRGWGFPIPDGCLTASAGSGAAPQDLFVRSLRPYPYQHRAAHDTSPTSTATITVREHPNIKSADRTQVGMWRRGRRCGFSVGGGSCGDCRHGRLPVKLLTRPCRRSTTLYQTRRRLDRSGNEGAMRRRPQGKIRTSDGGWCAGWAAAIRYFLDVTELVQQSDQNVALRDLSLSR